MLMASRLSPLYPRIGNCDCLRNFYVGSDGEELGLSISRVCVMSAVSIRLGTTFSFHGAGIQFRYRDDGITRWGSRLR